MWRALGELYGPSFYSSYGDEPTQIWAASIAQLTDDECRDGLTRLVRESRSFGPNVTEFFEACRPKSAGVRYLGRPLTKDEQAALSLPRPRADPEHVRKCLENMRRNLGAPQRDDQGVENPATKAPE